MTPNFELLENNVTSLSSHFWIIFYPTNIAGILISWRLSHGLRFLDLPQEGLIPQPLRAGRTVSGQGHWDTGTLGHQLGAGTNTAPEAECLTFGAGAAQHAQLMH